MIVRHLQPRGLAPGNGYSHVTVASGRIVHISGQVPLLPDGTLVAGGAEDQTEQVFQNLESALAAVDASWGDVVKVTFYLREIADLDQVRRVRDRFLQPPQLPASSLVQVVALADPAFLIEVDAVAVIEG